MAAKKYEVTDEGLEWAQAFLNDQSVEKGKSYEFDLSVQQEKAVVAAGWLNPKGAK